MSKKMKNLMVGMVIICLMLSGTSVYADAVIKVSVDVEEINIETMLQQNRTMVPMSALEEVLDVSISVLEGQILLSFEEKTMALEVGSDKVLLNGEEMSLDTSVIDIEGDVWVPFASVAQLFGHGLSWNEQTRTVEVMTRTNRLFSEYVRAIAATGSLLLNGEMGDLHEKIVASGEWDTPENEAFRVLLQEIHEMNEVTYVYTFIKSGADDEPALLISDSYYPEEYGTEYDMEPQFLTAFNGKPAYAVHFWEEDGVVMKSAFAPIYNSNGQVVAILGIDTVYDTMNHDANALISEKIKTMASTGSLLLKGEMGDLHEKIVASGEYDTIENEAFREILRTIREINDVTYVYTFIKSGTDEEPVLLISEADYPEEYGTEYDMEPQFLIAFSGVPAAAKHIWTDDGDVYKSAFAPIYNTAGEVVALLGVDALAHELSYVHELE